MARARPPARTTKQPATKARTTKARTTKARTTKARTTKARTTKPRAPAGRGVTFAQVRALARALPGVTEGTSYGTAAFRVGKVLLARRHDDPTLLVLKLVPGAREVLLEDDPDTFFITDHYAPYPAYVLVRLARAARPTLAMLLEQAWLASAPKKLVTSRS